MLRPKRRSYPVFFTIMLSTLACGFFLLITPAPIRANASDGTFQIAQTGSVVSLMRTPHGNLTDVVESLQVQTATGQYPAMVIQLNLHATVSQTGGKASGDAQVQSDDGQMTLFTGTVTGQLSARGLLSYQLANLHTATGSGGSLTYTGQLTIAKYGAITGSASGVLQFSADISNTVIQRMWPGAQPSVNSADPALWYITRGAALAAYVVLAAVSMLGIGISTQSFDSVTRRSYILDIHQVLTLTLAALITLHLVTLAIDPFLSFGIAHLFWPYSELYRPIPVALGVLGFYCLLVVAGSSWIKRMLPYRFWRMTHYVSFVAFVLVSLHGILAGTDTTTPWMIIVYVTGSVMVFAMVLWRIVQILLHHHMRKVLPERAI